MKNLKRVLSMALASVMLIGTMVVANAADFNDFTDKDEVVHTEAVSTMNLLGVIAGKDTGAFDPKGTVTRAEMAKMITVALNGGKDPVLGTKSTPSYTDIKGHWAESYIEYCSNLGIIAGIGGGLFDPNGTVTGEQASKMMLVAMGFDADIFGFVGADWSINTNRQANDSGLYDDLDDLLPSDGLSRDNAAQLIYNGIQSPIMTKSPSKALSTGEITYDYKLENTTGNVKTILSEKFKVKTNYGQLVKVDEDKLSIVYDANYVSKVTGSTSATDFTKVTADYAGYLGQTVKVMYKTTTDNVVGVAPLDCNKVVEMAKSGITVSSSKVKFNGSTYTLSTTAVTNHTANLIEDGAANGTTDAAGLSDEISYDDVKLVDNDGDGVYEYAVVTTKTTGKVTYASKTEIIAAGITYKYASATIADDIVKGDRVVVAYNPFTGKKEVTEIEGVNGKVAGTRTSAGSKPQYLLDGTWYTAPASLTGIVAGDGMTLWAVNNVTVDFKEDEGATTLDNVVMVLEADANGINRNVRVLHTDGSKAVVSFDLTTKSTGAAISLTAGALYTYVETDYGYEFKAAADFGDYTWEGSDVNFGSAANNTTKITTVGTADAKNITDDAIVFVYFGNDGKVITGKALKGMTYAGTTANAANLVKKAAKGFYTSKVENLERATLVGVELESYKSDGTNEDTTLSGVVQAANNYGLIVSNGYESNNNPRTVTYKIWTGEDTIEVTEKTSAGVSDRTQFTVVEYAKIDGNTITDVKKATTTTAPVYGIENSKASFDGTTMLNLTNKTVYMYYDSSTTAAESIGMAGGELVAADNVGDNTDVILVQNVREINDGTDVLFVLVDVKNCVADGTATTYTITDETISNATVSNNFASASNKAKAGDTVTVTITPASGYHLTLGSSAAVTASGVPAANIGAPVLNDNGTVTYTFTMPASTISPTVTGVSVVAD